jgi:formylmethanofuran dehydrogenase subunit B
MLETGEADAALIVGADLYSSLSPTALNHLGKIPTVVVDPNETQTCRRADVAFKTAVYGIHTGGTAYRMDDIPLSLRPAVTSVYPSDETVFKELEHRVKSKQAENHKESISARG